MRDTLFQCPNNKSHLLCLCSLLTLLQDVPRKAILVGLYAVSTKNIKLTSGNST